MPNKDSSKDYKLIIDMIHEMDEQYKILRDSAESTIKNTFGLNPEILDIMIKYTKDEIPNLSNEDIKDFIKEFYTGDSIKEEYNSKSSEELHKIMSEIKDMSLMILSAQESANQLKEESKDILNDYFQYMSSDKVKAARQKRLDTMKEALNDENLDEYHRHKIENMISIMESTMNFDFMLERFNKYGKQEVESINRQFLDSRYGTSIIERYTRKIPKFGFKADIYKHFFNLEETFLGEQYQVFNNLFLFIYMRMVAHSDPYIQKEKMFVQAITGAIADLIYHKFSSSESEQKFIDLMISILDNFSEYSEMYKERNTTYKGHELRIEAEKKRGKIRREALIKTMDRIGIKGYNAEAPIEELQDFYEREVDLLKKKQLEEYNQSEVILEDDETQDNVVEEDDGSVSILPTINKEEKEESKEVSTEDAPVDDETENGTNDSSNSDASDVTNNKN
jgi:hypothetical protein